MNKIPPPKLRYTLGRSNHGGEDGKYGTSKFHVNPYFNTVTASRRPNREQWIAEITPKDTLSGNPTTQGAISQTTTLSRCGRALSQDAPETDWQEYYG